LHVNVPPGGSNSLQDNKLKSSFQ